jgi:phosphoglycolate phosphatase
LQPSFIFDLDGTLVDSLGDLAASSNYVLNTLGFPTIPTDRYRYLVGNGVSVLIDRIIPQEQHSEKILRCARGIFDAHYSKHCFDRTRPYDGITDTLASLKERGAKLAVVSNKPDAFVAQIVSRLFGDTFDCVAGQRDGIPRKPDPALVFACCSAIGCTPADCRYIGDTSVDMLTARAAGAFGIGVLWGFRDRAELEQSGAGAIISAPGELLGFLDEDENK